MNKSFYWCSSCLNMSTRPRISFDDLGRCNACQWAEEKKDLDWTKREKELQKILSHYKSKKGGFDCIVPVSGGKDSHMSEALSRNNVDAVATAHLFNFLGDTLKQIRTLLINENHMLAKWNENSYEIQ
jgi:hypothetical protein